MITEFRQPSEPTHNDSLLGSLPPMGDSNRQSDRADNLSIAQDSDPVQHYYNLMGCIDIANRKLIEGWVWDPNFPAERIELALIEDGMQLAKFVADQPRPTLVDVGIGDGRHAFSIELEQGLLTKDTHILHLQCSKTGAPVPGSPIVIDHPPDEIASFRGYVDEMNPDGIIGWIMDVNQPNRRCGVLLMEGDHQLATARGSRFRKGLKDAGIGDGHYEFKLPVPIGLLDGREHVLTVVEEVSRQALNPKLQTFQHKAVFSQAAENLCSAWAVISLYELLQGRDPENSFVIENAKSFTIRELFTSIVKSSEFKTNVLETLRAGTRLRHELTAPYPTPQQLYWLSSLLYLEREGLEGIKNAHTWDELFNALLPNIEAMVSQSSAVVNQGRA